jgi:hypothetical protein
MVREFGSVGRGVHSVADSMGRRTEKLAPAAQRNQLGGGMFESLITLRHLAISLASIAA